MQVLLTPKEENFVKAHLEIASEDCSATTVAELMKYNLPCATMSEFVEHGFSKHEASGLIGSLETKGIISIEKRAGTVISGQKGVERLDDLYWIDSDYLMSLNPNMSLCLDISNKVEYNQFQKDYRHAVKVASEWLWENGKPLFSDDLTSRASNIFAVKYSGDNELSFEKLDEIIRTLLSFRGGSLPACTDVEISTVEVDDVISISITGVPIFHKHPTTKRHYVSKVLTWSKDQLDEVEKIVEQEKKKIHSHLQKRYHPSSYLFTKYGGWELLK